MKISICFYLGDPPASWFVRMFTRNKGQKFSDVPGHCGIIYDGFVREFVFSGYFERPATAKDYEKTVDLEIPDESGLLKFLYSVRDGKYDFTALVCDILGRCLPKYVHLTDNRRGGFDCSRFSLAAAISGGWTPPHSVSDLQSPPSPNDLWTLLRTP